MLKVEGNILILMQQNYFIYQTRVLLIESYYQYLLQLFKHIGVFQN